MQVLDTQRLQSLAPSIFATQAKAEMSNKYALIPTGAVLSALIEQGWQPTYAGQTRSRLPGTLNTGKHVVRLRHQEMAVKAVGDIIPELHLLNSHDGTSAYQLHLGLFRAICSNGLVVADSVFDALRIRHSGKAAEQVVEASFRVIQEAPRVVEASQRMRGVQLLPSERLDFAQAALALRWDEADKAPVRAEQLLVNRRYDDRGSDLWSTFNVIQESLIRGGLRGRTSTGKRMTMRAVNSVTEDTRLNKSLWALAETIRTAKTTA